MISLIFWIIVGLFYYKIAIAIVFDSGVSWGASFIMAIVLSVMFQSLAVFYNRIIYSIGYSGNEAAKKFISLTHRKFRWFWMVGAIVDRVIVLLFAADLDNEMGTVMGGRIFHFLFFVVIAAIPFYLHQILFFSRIRNF